MSAISALTSSALNASPAASGKAAANSAQTMDFMKLLMTQMRNQNPMEPQSGADFMAQVAQFSQLDGINKMNQSITDLMALQGLTQSANLIGKTITYSKGAAGNTGRGVVGSVTMAAGKVQVVVGGTPVDLSQVRSIESGPRTSNNL